MDVKWWQINLWRILLTFAPSNTESPFLPISLSYPSEPTELAYVLTKEHTEIATRLNLREIAIYDLTQNVSGQQWFTSGNPQVKRLGFRMIIELGAIAAGATSTTAHGLTGNPLNFTYIGGTCITATPTYLPIPYASVTALNQQIEVYCDATNLYVINGAGAANITSAIIVLEYLKN